MDIIIQCTCTWTHDVTINDIFIETNVNNITGNANYHVGLFYHIHGNTAVALEYYERMGADWRAYYQIYKINNKLEYFIEAYLLYLNNGPRGCPYHRNATNFFPHDDFSELINKNEKEIFGIVKKLYLVYPKQNIDRFLYNVGIDSQKFWAHETMENTQRLMSIEDNVNKLNKSIDELTENMKEMKRLMDAFLYHPVNQLAAEAAERFKKMAAMDDKIT